VSAEPRCTASPYGIFYVIEADTIRVIAILHKARSPEHWSYRT
jgi:hypothetical protein